MLFWLFLCLAILSLITFASIDSDTIGDNDHTFNNSLMVFYHDLTGSWSKVDGTIDKAIKGKLCDSNTHRFKNNCSRTLKTVTYYYHFSVNDKKYQGYSYSDLDTDAKYTEGDSVRIYYDENNPQISRIEGENYLIHGSKIQPFLLLVCIIIIIVMVVDIGFILRQIFLFFLKTKSE